MTAGTRPRSPGFDDASCTAGDGRHPADVSSPYPAPYAGRDGPHMDVTTAYFACDTHHR